MQAFSVASKFYRSYVRGRQALHCGFWNTVAVHWGGGARFRMIRDGAGTFAKNLERFENNLRALYSNWEFWDANSGFSGPNSRARFQRGFLVVIRSVQMAFSGTISGTFSGTYFWT